MVSPLVHVIFHTLASRGGRSVFLAVALAGAACASDAKPPTSPGNPPEATTPPPSPQRDEHEKPVDYSRGTRVRLTGISVGAGVGFFRGAPLARGWYGPGWDGLSWWGAGVWNPWMWDPWFASPYWSAWAMPAAWIHPGYWSGFGQTPSSGEIELRTPNKDDAVMIDGAYARQAKDLQRFWLPPGAYVLSVADRDGNAFQRKVYVLSGKTLRLTATLSPPETETAPAATPEPESR